MAITFVQAHAAQSSSVTSLSVTISSTGAGNLLVVGTASTALQEPTSITDSQGDSFVTNKEESDDGSTMEVSGHYAYNILSGSTSVTANFSTSTNIALVATEYNGTGNVDPFVAGNTNKGGSGIHGPTVSAGSVTSNTSGSLFWAFVATAQNVSINAEAGWNDRLNGSNLTDSYDQEDLIGSGSNTATWTATGTGFPAIIMAFSPSTSMLDDETGLTTTVIRNY